MPRSSSLAINPFRETGLVSREKSRAWQDRHSAFVTVFRILNSLEKERVDESETREG